METIKNNSNKQAGKTSYSGRRRDTKRKSGYKSHTDATGGRYDEAPAEKYVLNSGQELKVQFSLPANAKDHFYGFGIYFRVNGTHAIENNLSKSIPSSFHEHPFPQWSKFGSIWRSNEPQAVIEFSIKAQSNCDIWIYSPSTGTVWHEYFDEARDSVLRNLDIFSPEGLFLVSKGDVKIISPSAPVVIDKSISLKECNRCARYLPVNFDNERSTLAFSNHCIARSPCKHKGFGILTKRDTDETIQLTYGFQLECRFCKKFAVNGALNPMRTADQMKEDGQRRRHFELLLSELNEMSPQMAYRHKTGKELTNEIWEKFNRQCFKCGTHIPSSKQMNLDHTRPLALLWQLDETATCLCKSCNSQKRDRSPFDFYEKSKLKDLSKITGIPLKELEKPSPNVEAIKNIMANLDWLYGKFLTRADLLKIRDGKVTAELVCKALDRVL